MTWINKEMMHIEYKDGSEENITCGSCLIIILAIGIAFLLGRLILP
jgi:hypothetical protein